MRGLTAKYEVGMTMTCAGTVLCTGSKYVVVGNMGGSAARVVRRRHGMAWNGRPWQGKAGWQDHETSSCFPAGGSYCTPP